MCGVVFVEGIPVDNKTWTLNVFAVTSEISNQELAAGSVARGYVWFVWLLSWPQVNVRESVAILIWSPFANPCWGTVNCIIPVEGSYTAAVLWCIVVVVLGYECSVALLSSKQVNINELSAILMCDPGTRLWLPIVITISPVVGL